MNSPLSMAYYLSFMKKNSSDPGAVENAMNIVTLNHVQLLPHFRKGVNGLVNLGLGVGS